MVKAQPDIIFQHSNIGKLLGDPGNLRGLLCFNATPRNLGSRQSGICEHYVLRKITKKKNRKLEMVLPVGRIQETGNAAPLPSVPAGVGGDTIWKFGSPAGTRKRASRVH
jgi:hypothetical protein